MIRVFIEAADVVDGVVVLQDAKARHVGGALRARPGEELVAVTPDGMEHRARVRSASQTQVECEVLDSHPTLREPSRQLRVLQALLKGDQFERILEYGSELGVSSFQPLLTERTIPKPDEGRLADRMKRWEQVVRGGAQLGQRGRLPSVLPPANVADGLATCERDGMLMLFLYEGDGLPSLSDVDLGEQGLALVVGPEGGWSAAEVDAAEAAGAVAVTLGPRIMRPLPAVMTAVGAVFQRTGDLRQREV